MKDARRLADQIREVIGGHGLTIQTHKRKFSYTLVPLSFLIFLIVIYVLVDLKMREAANLSADTINGLVSAQLYPDWFFQLLVVLVSACLVGFLFTTKAYDVVRGANIRSVDGGIFQTQSDSSGGELQIKNRAGLVLDFIFLVYLVTMLADAIWAIVTGGLSLRIDWFPFVDASAYGFTAVVYALTGFWLFRRFGWRAVIPLCLIGVLQDGTWNIAYVILYPGFLGSLRTTSWLEYILVIMVAAVPLIILQRKLLRVHLRKSLASLVFPLYFCVYFVLGMPTLDTTGTGIRTSSILFEGVYVIACIITYLGSVGLDVPGRTDAGLSTSIPLSPKFEGRGGNPDASIKLNPISKFFLYKRHGLVRYAMRDVHSKVLDVGCGLYRVRGDAIGMDVKAWKRPDIVGSVFEIPFPEDYFDCVTMLELLEHMDAASQHHALDEINRILEPGGLFVLSMPNMSKWWGNPYKVIWAVWEVTVQREYRHEHIGMFPQAYIEMLLGEHFDFVQSQRVAWVGRIYVCRKARSSAE